MLATLLLLFAAVTALSLFTPQALADGDDRDPVAAVYASGFALTEGDAALRTAEARTRFGVDGSGVRVAVISDGIRGLQQAQADGEAPKLVEALSFGKGDINAGEEGTAMIEVVHDIAPGAAISFGAISAEGDHIKAVNHFAPRVDIIVDDTSFMLPADQSSDVSRNTTAALEHPEWPLRLYVTAAGNWAQSHWSGDWWGTAPGDALNLPDHGDVQIFNIADTSEPFRGTANQFSVARGDTISMVLFWDDAWGRALNDYNLYLTNADGEVVASSETRQGIGMDHHLPQEFIDYTHTDSNTQLYAVIQNRRNEAAPVGFDLFVLSRGNKSIQLQHRNPQGSILAQSDARHALTVGAVNVGETVPAPYSSMSETKPEIYAVDGVSVSQHTRFAPTFDGSSAAAPHVAGAAALLLDAQPALLAADGGNAIFERRLIRELLIETARPLSVGAGVLDAVAAIERALTNITVVTSMQERGPGSLQEALSSDARVVLFSSSTPNPTIRLATGTVTIGNRVVDGSGWTLDASSVQVGLQLDDSVELWGLTVSGAAGQGIIVAGDKVQLNDVRVQNNRIGVWIEGDDAEIQGLTAVRNSSHGVGVFGGSATITSSTIAFNQESGVRVHELSGDVIIGEELAPAARRASGDVIPIGVLEGPAYEPRAGLSHTIEGSVSVDGLPAPEGTRISVYLDRRLAAAVAVDANASFVATVTGPGAELRFTVDGVAAPERIDFAAGEATTVSLRGISHGRRFGVDRSDRPPAGANRIQNNLVGVQLDATDNAAGDRIIGVNLINGNRTSIRSDVPQPTIDMLAWTAAGLRMMGTAEGAIRVHLYAGPADSSDGRRFAASATVRDGRFVFSNYRRAPRRGGVLGHRSEQLPSVQPRERRTPSAAVGEHRLCPSKRGARRRW